MAIPIPFFKKLGLFLFLNLQRVILVVIVILNVLFCFVVLSSLGLIR